MTKKIIQTLLVLASVAILPGLSWAGDNANGKLLIVYAGNVEGEIRPTMICGPKLAGGFPRKATRLKELRQEGHEILMVDNGGLVGLPGDRNLKWGAELALELYNEIGLDALNLGKREFFFGTDFLAQASEKFGYPLISSNIAAEDAPWLKPYVITEKGGMKIGIVGVLPEDAFAEVDPEMVSGFTIKSPESALIDIIPELEEKTDFIVLLSRFDIEETTSLLESFTAINLAVASSDKTICENPMDLDKIVVPSGLKGHYFLSAEVEKDEDGLRIKQNQPLALDSAVTTNEEIAQLIAKANDEKMERIRKQRTEMQIMQDRTVPVLSREEFRRRIVEQQVRLRDKEQAGEGEEPKGEKVNAVLKYKGKVVPAEIRIIRQNKRNDEDNATKE